MNNYIPFEKLSKKKKKEYYASQRGTWNGVNPVTKVVPNKKLYNRKKQPKDFGCYNFMNSPCIIIYN